jgi:ubiquinone/menaquinone biosynthesis C-methylase UbiE
MAPDRQQWVATEAWEDSYQRTRRNLGTRMRRIKHFEIPTSALILDFGCGDGLDLQAFKKLGYDRVIGLDNSAYLLQNLKAFRSIQGDAYTLSFPANCFDVVFVNSVFHHLHLEPALASIQRVLQQNGRLCFIEPRNSPVRKLLDWLTFSPLAHLSPVLSHRRVTLLDEYDEHYGWLSLEGSLENTLCQMGFSNIEIQTDWINMFVSCHKGISNLDDDQ